MSLLGTVELPGLQAKSGSVMPAPDQSRGQAPAGIQGGEGAAIKESLDSRPGSSPGQALRGNDGRDVEFQSTNSEPLDLSRG